MPEVRLLRIAIAVACMVPIIAGGMGVLLGPGMFGINTATVVADSHYRYLSGLLFGIGILFLTTVPRIETSTARFRLLAIIVIVVPPAACVRCSRAKGCGRRRRDAGAM